MKLSILLILAGIFILPSALQAQQKLKWDDLAKITFEKVYVEEFDLDFNKPTFSKQLSSLKDKEVEITGYILPLDIESNYYILSRFPFSACYFCGGKGAGPETVIELKLKEGNVWYQMDDILTFRGKLVLNDTEIHQLYYIMIEAEEID